MVHTVRYLVGAVGESGFGSKSTAEDVTTACCLHSITALITGATSGIGAETARVLAKRGASLVISARNLKAAEDVSSRIREETPTAEIIVMELDLSSFGSIRALVANFQSLELPLNLLINNAGKFCNKFDLSKDGFEMTFPTNHLGHFLLTNLLLDKMIETARETGIGGRIVNVSSAIHKWVGKEGIHFHQLNNPKRYNSTRAYARSKLANILHTKELAFRLKQMKASVTANSVHPGIVRTRITRDREGIITGHNYFLIKFTCYTDFRGAGPLTSILLISRLHFKSGSRNTYRGCYFADFIFFVASKLLKSIPRAASTTCYVAVHPQLRNLSGKYFADCNEASSSSLANCAEQAMELWKVSESMVASRVISHVNENQHGIFRPKRSHHSMQQ